MRKAKNIYFLLIKTKRDGPRQGVAQGRIPSSTRCKLYYIRIRSSPGFGFVDLFAKPHLILYFLQAAVHSKKTRCSTSLREDNKSSGGGNFVIVTCYLSNKIFDTDDDTVWNICFVRQRFSRNERSCKKKMPFLLILMFGRRGEKSWLW